MAAVTFNPQEKRHRINGNSMQQFIGQQVVLLGECLAVDPNGRNLKIKATDDQVILVVLSQPTRGPIEPNSIVEVEGIPESRNKLRVYNYTAFPLEMSETFDKGLYNSMIEQLIIHGKDHYAVDDLTPHWGSNSADAIDLLPVEGSDQFNSTFDDNMFMN